LGLDCQESLDNLAATNERALPLGWQGTPRGLLAAPADIGPGRTGPGSPDGTYTQGGTG